MGCPGVFVCWLCAGFLLEIYFQMAIARYEPPSAIEMLSGKPG